MSGTIDLMNDMVATPEDLESLPLGTIVKIGPGPADLIVRAGRGDTALGDWEHPGNDMPSKVSDIRAYWPDAFPARIIYRPECDGHAHDWTDWQHRSVTEVRGSRRSEWEVKRRTCAQCGEREEIRLPEPS